MSEDTIIMKLVTNKPQLVLINVLIR